MSIPDIIDNSEYQLFDVLNELLETGKPADFASGFFNIGGYALVREKLNGRKFEPGKQNHIARRCKPSENR